MKHGEDEFERWRGRQSSREKREGNKDIKGRVT